MKEHRGLSLEASPELIAIFATVLAIPFYLGIVHWAVPQMLLYSGAASASMTTGGFMDEPQRLSGGVKLFLLDMALWLAIIVPVGGVAYLIAWLF